MVESHGVSGSLRADDTEGLEDFIGDYNRLAYDDQIGTIGGGNHFMEVQRVAEIYDGQTANVWNLEKGAVVVIFGKSRADILKKWEKTDFYGKKLNSVGVSLI